MAPRVMAAPATRTALDGPGDQAEVRRILPPRRTTSLLRAPARAPRRPEAPATTRPAQARAPALAKSAIRAEIRPPRCGRWGSRSSRSPKTPSATPCSPPSTPPSVTSPRNDLAPEAPAARFPGGVVAVRVLPRAVDRRAAAPPGRSLGIGLRARPTSTRDARAVARRHRPRAEVDPPAPRSRGRRPTPAEGSSWLPCIGLPIPPPAAAPR